MKDRIIKFLTHENLTATKFADEIGVQRSSVSHILSGRNNPSFEFIQKILIRYKNLNAEWLMLGNGTMYKKAEQMNLFNSTTAPAVPLIPEPKSNPSAEKSSSQESHKIIQPVIESEISPAKKIERILIFYSDKTFDEYSPAK